MPKTDIPILDEEQIAAIEARANAATDGWYIEDERDAVRYGFRIYDKYHQGVCQMTSGGEFHDRPHSQLIAHARIDIPALCQTVRVLREQLAQAERQRDDALVRAVEDQDYDSEQRAALAKQLEQVTKERDQFSELADKRHDELCTARRQRDDLAAKCAPYLEQLK